MIQFKKVKTRCIMINIIFNYDIYDHPYNQNELKKGIASLKQFADKKDQDVYIIVGSARAELFDNGADYISVEHTDAFSQAEKQEIVNAIKQLATFKKSVYGDDKPAQIVVFKKIDQNDCFVF